MRHDEPKNLFASLTSEVYRDVEIEPPLEPLNGEQLPPSANKREDARSDVRVRGYWSKGRDAFFEFRVSYPFATTYKNQKPHKLCRSLERKRKCEYEQRVRQVEDADFTPMVMLSTGGMGEQASIALKHLAELLAKKRNEDYAHVSGLIRCCFAFALARSALVCLRGTRSKQSHYMDPFKFKHFKADVAMSEISMSG